QLSEAEIDSASYVLIRTARHDADGVERVDGLAVLIIRGPLDPDDTLRLGPRRNQFNHLAFEVKRIAGPDWFHPAQIVDAGAQQRMRPERPDLDRKVHGNGGRVPSGRG